VTTPPYKVTLGLRDVNDAPQDISGRHQMKFRAIELWRYNANYETVTSNLIRRS
jgi:hypothetical protein